MSSKATDQKGGANEVPAAGAFARAHSTCEKRFRRKKCPDHQTTEPTPFVRVPILKSVRLARATKGGHQHPGQSHEVEGGRSVTGQIKAVILVYPSAALVRRTEQEFWIWQGSLQESRQYCLNGISTKNALLQKEVQADHRGKLVGRLTKMERAASETGQEFLEVSD